MKRLLLSVLAMAVLGLATGTSLAQSNGNPYAPAYGHPYRHGVVPTREAWVKMQQWKISHAQVPLTSSSTLSYRGGGSNGIGVTSGTPRVYIVFWGNQWGTQYIDSHGNLTFSSDPAGAAPYLQQFFKGIGTDNELWSRVMTQYCDGPNVATGATSCPSDANFIGYPSGGAFAGVWYDNSGAEPQDATPSQIAQEAINAAAYFGNTTPAYNRYAQYDIVSSTGLNPDGFQNDGYCAWHDWTGDTADGINVSSPYGPISFTNMPYVYDKGGNCGEGYVNSPGTDDGFSIVNGHEYAETLTDQDPAQGWTNASTDAETADECVWILSGQGALADLPTSNGSYAMQSTWSNNTNECDMGSGTLPTPTITFEGQVGACVGGEGTYLIGWKSNAGKILEDYQLDYNYGSGWRQGYYGTNVQADVLLPASYYVYIRVRATDGTFWSVYGTNDFVTGPCPRR